MADNANEESAARQSESAEGPGARLKAAREAQELSIEELSAELRIRPEALRALERGDYAVIGVPVFAKGYLKQYGARLGLDVDALAAEYDARSDDDGIDIAPARPIDQSGQRSLTLWVLVGFVVLLIVGLGLYWWLGQSEPMSIFESLFN